MIFIIILFLFSKNTYEIRRGVFFFTKFYLIIFHILYRGIKYVEPNFIVLFLIYIHKKYHYYAIIQILYKINKKEKKEKIIKRNKKKKKEN